MKMQEQMKDIETKDVDVQDSMELCQQVPISKGQVQRDLASQQQQKPNPFKKAPYNTPGNGNQPMTSKVFFDYGSEEQLREDDIEDMELDV